MAAVTTGTEYPLLCSITWQNRCAACWEWSLAYTVSQTVPENCERKLKSDNAKNMSDTLLMFKSIDYFSSCAWEHSSVLLHLVEERSVYEFIFYDL